MENIRGAGRFAFYKTFLFTNSTDISLKWTVHILLSPDTKTYIWKYWNTQKYSSNVSINLAFILSKQYPNSLVYTCLWYITQKCFKKRFTCTLFFFFFNLGIMFGNIEFMYKILLVKVVGYARRTVSVGWILLYN